MKKLFLLLSLCAVVVLQASDAQEMIWVKPFDSVDPIQIPKGFSTIDNLENDLGESTSKDPIPLFDIDTAHLKHAVNFVRGEDHDQYMYMPPLTYKQLKDSNITLEGLLNTLNFLGVDGLLSKFYVSWLNQPQNENAAVHEGASGQTIFNQMGLDTNKINEEHFLLEKVSADRQFYADNVNGYGARQNDSGASIQDLIDKKLNSHIVYHDYGMKRISVPSPGELLRGWDDDFIVREPLGPWQNNDEFLRALDDLYRPLEALREEKTPYITSLKGLSNIPDKNEIWEFKITGQGIGSLKSGVFKGFHNLQKIFIRDCKNLQRIFPGVFAGVSKLEYLNVIGCGLARISGDMFHGLSSLVSLSLNNNNIVKIEENAFEGTPKLKSLDLSYNKITHLTAETFVGLDLITLSLQGNPLESIDSKTFANLTTLESLGIIRTPEIEALMRNVALPAGCRIHWAGEDDDIIVEVTSQDGTKFLFDRFRKIVMEGKLHRQKQIVDIDKVHGHVTHDQYINYFSQYPDLASGDFDRQFTMMPNYHDLRYDFSSGLVWRVLDSYDNSKRRYDEAGPHLITLQEMEAYRQGNY